MDKHPYELFGKYLSENISNEERASVEKWIRDSEDNQKFFEEVQKIWQSSSIRLSYQDLDGLQLLRELQILIDQQQRPFGKVVSIMRPYKLYWRVAAGICLLMVSYFVVRWATRENIIIEAGDQVATVYLPDSTKIWLNINSRITYPINFETRKVELQGEAFLSVRKDTTDFTVNTEHTSTTVFGTAFNVKEQADSSVTLTVAEGAVKFSKKDTIQGQSTIVKARQKVVFMPRSKLQRTQNDDLSFAHWREQNNLSFEEERSRPDLYLINDYVWRKNRINQSVIEGTFKNNASLAAYNKVVLEVTYTKPDGNQVIVDLTIADTVYPGKRLSYRKRLLDILSDTKSIIVKIKSASVTTKNSY